MGNWKQHCFIKLRLIFSKTAWNLKPPMKNAISLIQERRVTNNYCFWKATWAWACFTMLIFFFFFFRFFKITKFTNNFCDPLYVFIIIYNRENALTGKYLLYVFKENNNLLLFLSGHDLVGRYPPSQRKRFQKIPFRRTRPRNARRLLLA